MDMPSANQVAWAIVAACRETGADPVAVAEGINVCGSRESSRARSYAAYALNELFRCGPVAIGRMVGSGAPSSFLSTLSWNLKKDKVRWWEDAAAERVIDAVKAADPKRSATAEDILDEPSEPEPPKQAAPAQPRRHVLEVAPIVRTPKYERDAYRPAGGILRSPETSMSSLREAVLNTQRMTPRK